MPDPSLPVPIPLLTVPKKNERGNPFLPVPLPYPFYSARAKWGKGAKGRLFLTL